jgi:hypothetical protein
MSSVTEAVFFSFYCKILNPINDDKSVTLPSLTIYSTKKHANIFICDQKIKIAYPVYCLFFFCY